MPITDAMIAFIQADSKLIFLKPWTQVSGHEGLC